MEDREEALLENFQVMPILVDCMLDAQMSDEEIQELILLRNQGKKKARLDEAHGSIYAIRPKGIKMYHTIRQFSYWPGMKRELPSM